MRLRARPASKGPIRPSASTASPAQRDPTRRTKSTASSVTRASTARPTARRVVRSVRLDGISPRPARRNARFASPAASLRPRGKLRATSATRARTVRPPARRPASTARPGGFSPSRVGANASSAQRGDLPRVPPPAAAAGNSARGAGAPQAPRPAISAIATTTTTDKVASTVPGRRRARGTRRYGARGSCTRASIASPWTRRASIVAKETTAAWAVPGPATPCARTTTADRSASCATKGTTWSQSCEGAKGAIGGRAHSSWSPSASSSSSFLFW